MNKTKIGFAMCGSFCTIAQALKEINLLVNNGYDVTPILSPIVYNTNTRFTVADDLQKELQRITGNNIIHTITEAEPIGPKKMFDALIVCPCTGNTLAKLTYGITDTSVTMAVKAHIRNGKPVVIALATNDALASTAKNIGFLLNTRHYYFVPLRQDDPINKERSIVSDFSLVEQTLNLAMQGKQISPII